MQSKRCKDKIKCQIQIVIEFSGLMFVDIIYELAESRGRDNHHHLVLGLFRVCWHPVFMGVITQFRINKLKANEGWKCILLTEEGGENTLHRKKIRYISFQFNVIILALHSHAFILQLDRCRKIIYLY